MHESLLVMQIGNRRFYGACILRNCTKTWRKSSKQPKTAPIPRFSGKKTIENIETERKNYLINRSIFVFFSYTKLSNMDYKDAKTKMTNLCGTLFEKIIFRALLARESLSENFTTANKIRKMYIKLHIPTTVQLMRNCWTATSICHLQAYSNIVTFCKFQTNSSNK